MITYTNFKRRKQCLKKFKILAVLAWYLLSNICAKVIEKIWNSLHSQTFINTDYIGFWGGLRYPPKEAEMFRFCNQQS